MKETRIIKREEGEIIPEGLSATETRDTFYIRYRFGDQVTLVKIKKSNGAIYDTAYNNISREDR